MYAQVMSELQNIEYGQKVLDEIKKDSPESVELMNQRVHSFMQENNVSMMGGWTL